VILCDTGPLVAAFNEADNDHARCVRFLRENWSRLVVPSLAVTEICHLPSRAPQPPVSQARHRAFARAIWCGVRQDTLTRSGLATMMAKALAREVATFSRCGS
jgi:predicted nucleic acid-binding protein